MPSIEISFCQAFLQKTVLPVPPLLLDYLQSMFAFFKIGLIPLSKHSTSTSSYSKLLHRQLNRQCMLAKKIKSPIWLPKLLTLLLSMVVASSLHAVVLV